MEELDYEKNIKIEFKNNIIIETTIDKLENFIKMDSAVLFIDIDDDLVICDKQNNFFEPLYSKYCKGLYWYAKKK